MTLQVLVDPVAEAVLQRRDDHLDCGELKFKKKASLLFPFLCFLLPDDGPTLYNGSTCAYLPVAPGSNPG